MQETDYPDAGTAVIGVERHNFIIFIFYLSPLVCPANDAILALGFRHPCGWTRPFLVPESPYSSTRVHFCFSVCRLFVHGYVLVQCTWMMMGAPSCRRGVEWKSWTLVVVLLCVNLVACCVFASGACCYCSSTGTYAAGAGPITAAKPPVCTMVRYVAHYYF